MSFTTISAEQVSDNETRRQCNELILLVDSDVELALNAHHTLNSYLKKTLTEDKSFYSADELKFLIALIQQLSSKIENEKKLVATKIISKQKSKNAVKKYKSHF
ncbi:hypothetical protein [Pseudoalteromonas distincta]|uniref:hypothetical protein n=1 Tax=Pseudoalteromonas distincta TaxID=77608 RepID=UPI0039E8BC78